MKLIAIVLLFCLTTLHSVAQSTEKEKAVKAYYTGFETHDWNLASSRFTANFTFTSANNDNHISIAQFKSKCWPTNRFFKKVNLIRMTESGNDLYLLVEITTTDHKIVRNVDIFHFNSGQIQTIETFFGRGESFPGNQKK